MTEGKFVEIVGACDTETLLRGRPGRMYRVAAAAGTNEGLRPTFFCADELHEWVGTRRVVVNPRMGRSSEAQRHT